MSNISNALFVLYIFKMNKYKHLKNQSIGDLNLSKSEFICNCKNSWNQGTIYLHFNQAFYIIH